MTTEHPNATGRRGFGWRSALDTIATLSIIAVAVSIVWGQIGARKAQLTQSRGAAAKVAVKQLVPSLPSDPLDLNGTPTKGSHSAPVGVVEFSDFQCPFCGTFARETLPTVEKTLIASGRVVFSFREFPLAQIHPFARQAANAAACSAGHGHFWEMQDALFRNQDSLEPAHLRRLAETVGIDIGAFDACIATDSPQVTADVALAAQLGLHGTPTFFFGQVTPDGRVKASKLASGALTVAQFTDLVSEVEKRPIGQMP